MTSWNGMETCYGIMVWNGDIDDIMIWNGTTSTWNGTDVAHYERMVWNQCHSNDTHIPSYKQQY